MKYLFFALISIGLISCSSSRLTPFTSKIYQENDWSGDELSSIQFYLSDDIVLWREAGKSDASIDNGKIRMVDGRRIEEVIFKEGTPGTVLFSPKYGHFAIGFEENEENFLMFGPSKKVGGRYVLLAKEWKKGKGKISYGGKVWNTYNESAFSTLLVDLKARKKTEYRSKTVGGRRI